MDTLRVRMDDLERGQRIKTARLTRHLTQPAVVELFEERAREAGWEPKRPGDHPLSLRGYQEWEAGGGIRWDNAKLLAGVLGLDAEYLMSGHDEESPTPDLSLREVRNEFRPDVDFVQRELDQIKAMLADASSERERIEQAVELEAENIAAQNANLETQSAILSELRDTMREIRDLVSVLQNVSHIERVVDATVRRVLPEPEAGPAAKRQAAAKPQPQPRAAKRTG